MAIVMVMVILTTPACCISLAMVMIHMFKMMVRVTVISNACLHSFASSTTGFLRNLYDQGPNSTKSHQMTFESM